MSSLEASRHVDLIIHLQYPDQLHVAVRHGLLQRKGSGVVRRVVERPRQSDRDAFGREACERAVQVIGAKALVEALHDISCLAHLHPSRLIGSTFEFASSGSRVMPRLASRLSSTTTSWPHCA